MASAAATNRVSKKAGKTARRGTAGPNGAKPQARAQATRRSSEGHGRRLTAAFEALEAFPALAESRNRLLRVVSQEQSSVPDMVATVESDVALVIAVMRLANRRFKGGVGSVVDAVEILTPNGVEALAESTQTFDFFERTPVWDSAPDKFRLHALATQRAAARLAQEADFTLRDELMVSSLLHDIGTLVLAHAYPGYPGQIHGSAQTPEQRVHAERRELGVDHALVGGVLARRWGLPDVTASAIERHHADDSTGAAAIIRLADMLAHYSHDQPVAPDQLLHSARRVGLGPQGLRTVLYEIPFSPGDRKRRAEPCPLSARELDVLKRLADGKVYKQIALELGLSTSTVRTHLHNVYGKVGAVDRAQAVLIASERGWL